jgi:hypothetical protein
MTRGVEIVLGRPILVDTLRRRAILDILAGIADSPRHA